MRASAMLARVRPAHPAWQTIIDTAGALLGQRPSLDFALVAVRRHLQLPLGAAFGLFFLLYKSGAADENRRVVFSGLPMPSKKKMSRDIRRHSQEEKNYTISKDN